MLEPVEQPPQPSSGRESLPNPIRSVAIAALAALIVIGSGFLWIGLPILGLWIAGELTTTREGFLFATLGGIPTAMASFGWLLYRVNDLYVRVHGDDPAPTSARAAWLRSTTDERSRFRRARGPRTLIDVAMTVSAVTALVLLTTWFFFLAERPLAPLP